MVTENELIGGILVGGFLAFGVVFFIPHLVDWWRNKKRQAKVKER